MCQLPRGKSFCASYLEDVDDESIQKLCASVPTVPLLLPETSSSLGAGLDESSEGHAACTRKMDPDNVPKETAAEH